MESQCALKYGTRNLVVSFVLHCLLGHQCASCSAFTISTFLTTPPHILGHVDGRVNDGGSQNEMLSSHVYTGMTTPHGINPLK